MRSDELNGVRGIYCFGEILFWCVYYGGLVIDVFFLEEFRIVVDMVREL